MSDFQRQINHKIESFVAEITELAREAAKETLANALDGSGVSARYFPKRSPDEVLADANRLYSFIEGNPGKRAEELAAELEMTTKQISLPIKKLISSKRIKTQGKKRATRYFPTATAVGRRRKRNGKSK